MKDTTAKRTVSKGQLIVGCILGLAVIGGITNVLGGGSDNAAATTPAPVAPATTSYAPPTQADSYVPDDVDIPTVNPTDVQTPTEEVAEPMPDVVGMNLQAAQDEIQKGGVFYSKSQDATGMKRHQILDADWVVVAQSPAPGEIIGNGDAVLSVVKIGEQN